jgi:pyrimidine-nucleoside phosphorylase
MRAVDLIRKKRDGESLSRADLEWFVQGVTAGSWPDYQIAALLMAIVLRGMSLDETTALTRAMTHSGARVDLSDLAGVKVDKHSTGGVGDKTSLVLAPLAAACGVKVPMMSGRALGHTGGTLDKLESIPGFRTGLRLEEFRDALERVGCALIGQSEEVAPADRKLYALRDVTATVESMPLIAASILSKKIAEGIDALVLDVKVGRGAFMTTVDAAQELASLLVSIGRAEGVRTTALISAMDVPLGRTVGNALEVIECFETLKGGGPQDLEHLSVRLAAEMLCLAGVEASLQAAEKRVRAALASGAGLEKCRDIIASQGGDPRVIDEYDRLPGAREHHVIPAPSAGHLTGLHAGLIGRAAMVLGAGRDRVDAPIDHGVGISLLAVPGDSLRAGDPVLELLYSDAGRLDEAVALATEAIEIGPHAPAAPPLVLATIS